MLQHPAAAQRLLGALTVLPASTQARAYRLWVQQLAAQPAGPSVPAQLQSALLEQLRQCFTVRSLDLGLAGGSEALGQTAQQGASAGDAAAGASGEGPPGAEVHVALRQQLPALLQLLLRVACSSGEAAASVAAAAAAAGAPGEGNNSGRGSANVPQAPSLSTVQSAVVARRDPRRRGSSAAAASQAARAASAEASSAAAGAVSSSSARSSVLESVLQHAVLLIGRLSDPDALHEMLGIQLRRPAHSSGSDDEQNWEEAEGQQERQQEAASAAASDGQRLLSRRDAERISTAAALIEVCLDGMLSLPPLAAAVHQQLHSKGNSNAAAVGNAAAGEAAAEVAQEQQDAAAELRTTAGLMLGMHRELSRLLAEHRQQLQGALHCYMLNSCFAGEALLFFGAQVSPQAARL